MQSLFFQLSRHLLSCLILLITLTLSYYVAYSLVATRPVGDLREYSWEFLRDMETLRVERGRLTSSWQCEGEGKKSVCVVENLCVDRERGAFVVESSAEAPLYASMDANAREEQNDYWAPRVIPEMPGGLYGFVNETVFVYGFGSEDINEQYFRTILSLWSTMKDHGATANSWLLRPYSSASDSKALQFDISFLAPQGREVVFSAKHRSSHFQIEPSSKPLCFRRAVVGLKHRCALASCKKKIGGEYATSLRAHIIGNRRPVDVHTPVVGLLEVEAGGGPIANLDELDAALAREGFTTRRVRPISMTQSFGEQVDEYAKLAVLIAPGEMGLVPAALMARSATLISINAQHATNEEALQYPMLAVGRRVYAWECRSPNCTIVAEGVARKCLEEAGLGAEWIKENDKAFSKLTRLEPIFWSVLNSFDEEDEVREARRCYGRRVPKRVEVKTLVEMVGKIIAGMGYSEKGHQFGEEFGVVEGLEFVDICRAARCCGPSCEEALATMVFGTENVWGLKPGPMERDLSWELEA
ncbi:uncharacterized protein VTP21DRAFT_3390 [Calcarisporiella thermophila]|uniref:uncharacterized protein n=1 Tax=Calcarisporiella thermophila TaxID=911321 RepID=UPI003741F580